MKLLHWKNLFLTIIFTSLLSCAGGAAKQYDKGVIPRVSPPSGTQIAQTRNLLKQSAVKSKMKLYSSGAYYNRAKRIVTRLSNAAGLGGFSYPVYIADAGNTVNAMAVNDNTIVVFRKLMDNIKSDTTLSVVLAHEVSHMLSRHGSDKVIQARTSAVAIGSAILGAIVASKTGNSNAGAAARDISATAGAGAFLRPYSRSMELEADHVGMLLMAKAGYNPRSAISFWGNSKKYLGSSGSNSFLSTHPSPGNRKAQLQRTLPLALKYYKK